MRKGTRDVLVLGLVVALIALVAWRLLGGRGEDPRHDVPTDVELCVERMRTLHRALVEHARDSPGFDGARGAAVLGALFTSGVLTDDATTRELLACPGPGSRSLEPWTDATKLTAANTGYAVRDLDAAPLPTYPTGGENPFLACDQAGGENHAGVLNVLYADGSVRTLRLEDLKERRQVSPETSTLDLGPESELVSLRVFPTEP